MQTLTKNSYCNLLGLETLRIKPNNAAVCGDQEIVIHLHDRKSFFGGKALFKPDRRNEPTQALVFTGMEQSLARRSRPNVRTVYDDVANVFGLDNLFDRTVSINKNAVLSRDPKTMIFVFIHLPDRSAFNEISR